MDNIVVTNDLPEKKPTKKAPAKSAQKKIISPEPSELPAPQKSDIPEKKVAHAAANKKFVYYSSGAGYTTKSGHRFTPDQRIYEIDIEEAEYLLKLDNFRLPDQIELEDYYKEQE